MDAIEARRLTGNNIRMLRISYWVPEQTHVVLSIDDARGGHVITLVDDESDAGRHIASWDAREVSGGLYFCRLTMAGFRTTRNMVFLR